MNWMREPGQEPLPGYRLIEPLGTGGFGEVWKCEAPGGIYKAIKFVYGNLNSLDGEALRAEQELKALQRVKEVRHPFVCSMERIDIVAGELLIVMELAEKTLHDCLVDAQSINLPGIPRDILLGYMRDAAEGLDFLNDKHNLQHLDVKPRNLFIIADRVKVADFGLVKHLERSTASGFMGGVSPIYAAPETFSGKVSRHSDQYSLGIVYMELLTGKRPFNGRNIRQLAIQHMTEPPDLSSLSPEDQAVLRRALAKDPSERFPSCLAFVRALYSGVAEEGATRPLSQARPVSSPSLEEIDLGMIRAATAPPLRLPPILPSVPSVPARPPSRPTIEEPDSNRQLQATVQQAEIASIRPALIIGIGSFGRRALLELRCRLLDRFGDLAQVPLFRFLYIDSDNDGLRKAITGSPDLTLSSTEVFPLPLQPVGNYRRRMLEHLNDWLPREKLYTIPRSLQPQGCRALGRLAFSDNYLRLVTRLRRELQVAAHPESLAQAVSQTGLVLRDTVPSVYVLAAAGGGSSGMLVDLGFAVQHLLQQLGHQRATVNAFLFCGAPNDPATSRAEQANLVATLTELNHYTDSSIAFTAQYGPDGPQLSSHAAPYSSIYITQIEHRTQEQMRDCVAHLAGYLSHELTTPLGSKLERMRGRPSSPDYTPFRSLGTYSIWFPRGLLLRLAARRVCAGLLGEWANSQPPKHTQEIDSICQKTLNDPALRWELLVEQLESTSHSPTEGTPRDTINGLLGTLEEELEHSGSLADPGLWAREAMDQVREWVGVHSGSDAESLFRKSRLSRQLAEGCRILAERWDQHLSSVVAHLMEQPGRRLAVAETAFRRMSQFFAEAAIAQRGLVQQQGRRTQQARAELQAALEACQSGAGGFSLFGGRTNRTLRYFLDQLKVFAEQRLQEELTEAGVQFFHRLQGRIDERLRDLTFCRQRLVSLQEWLTSSGLERLTGPGLSFDMTQSPSPPPVHEMLNEALQSTPTLQVVLPGGGTDIEQCALALTAQLRPEHWHRLDQVCQSLVLAPLGGLYHVCMKSSDLSSHLSGPLIDQTAAFLGELIPNTDVAEVELHSASNDPARFKANLQQYIELSEPLVAVRSKDNQVFFLLVPPSQAGNAISQELLTVCPNAQIVVGNSQTDLLFCHEQGNLRNSEVAEIFRVCIESFQEARHSVVLSPFARFDVSEWLPLYS
jgi:serine/threonine protein kinase